MHESRSNKWVTSKNIEPVRNHGYGGYRLPFTPARWPQSTSHTITLGWGGRIVDGPQIRNIKLPTADQWKDRMVMTSGRKVQSLGLIEYLRRNIIDQDCLQVAL